MLKIIEQDPYLKPYEGDLMLRMSKYEAKRRELNPENKKISDFANGYLYFGLHFLKNGEAVFREWAPEADSIYIYGDFNGWNANSLPLKRLNDGIWEIYLQGENVPKNGQKYKLLVEFNGAMHERIPSYATYVVQDPNTYLWSAEVYTDTFSFHAASPKEPKTPLIYECHIGMATEEYRVGTYREFRESVLPRIEKSGYNTIQIMAIMEHPYYASFGYQVSNFFTPSSRFGTPNELKELIEEAHKRKIRVYLDLIHSHACANEMEGLNRFDGSDYQYFHQGDEGNHPAWGTKLFDYNKNEVLHFLLSNLKYWQTEYRFDGFRFDGVTSMLYKHHGLGVDFNHYDKYFSMDTDVDAVTYLMLANELIHEVNPHAVTIAEDMSGMPGMCIPLKDGGIGFDYRLQMGTPDMWIKLLKENADETWDVERIYWEICGHRPFEKVVTYAESHDQALVGDKTIIFRLCDAAMYDHMQKSDPNLIIDRGIALHKMIRLITATLAYGSYLNFMGNEFGHPEWIDFPRDGNGWSYHYCRRQWSLNDNKDLKYSYLSEFDRAMTELMKKYHLYSYEPELLHMHVEDQVVAYRRGDLLFVFNFNPNRSYEGYRIATGKAEEYQMILTTDRDTFGGFNQLNPKTSYPSFKGEDGITGILTYLPARTAVVYKKKKRLFRLHKDN